MSRVGRLPIAIPAGVTVTVAEGNVVTVKGPKGQLVKAMDKDMNIAVEDNQVVVTRLLLLDQQGPVRLQLLT